MTDKKQNNIPASYLILMKDNKILLLRRYNTGFEDGKYSLVAGHVEAGETFTQCIIREAKEEAGLELRKEDLRVVHVMHRDSHRDINNERIDVFFTASKWKGMVINNEPHKCDDLSWFEKDKLPSNIIPYIQHAIENILHEKYYSEFGWDVL